MSADKFLDELEHQALLEPKIIAELRRQAASKRKVTSQSIAKLLVDKGRLTAFQAKNILAKVQEDADLTTDGEDAPDDDVVELNPAEPTTSAPAKPPAGLTPLPAGGGAAPAKPAKKRSGGLTPLTSENAVATGAPGLTPLTETAVAGGGLTPLTEDHAAGGLTPLAGTGDPFAGAAVAEGGGWMNEPQPEPQPDKQKGVFQSKKARSNQWDSPWLLIGGGVLLLSIILVGVLWYVLTRASEDEMFAAAEKSYNQESYSEAAQRYEEYLEKFPEGENAHQSRVRLTLAHIRLPVVSKDWEGALEVAKEELPTIEESLADYNEGRSELASLLPDIAEGFAKKADQLIAQVDPDTDRAGELVEFTEEGMKLVNNPVYLPTSEREKPAVASRITDITEMLGRVRYEIRAEEDLVAAEEQILELVDKSNTVAAYNVRKELLRKYPQLATLETKAGRRLQEATDFITQKEAELVQSFSETQDEAVTTDPKSPLLYTSVFANKIGQDISNLTGFHVAVLAQGTLYGLDTGTGLVKWRRRVNTTIHPQRVSPTLGSDVIAVDGRQHELLRLKAATGELVWRLPIGQRFAAPTIGKTWIIVSTESNEVLAVEPATGKVHHRAEIPQPLFTSAAFYQNQLLIQVGQHSNLYVLSPNDLDSKEVYYLGHKDGSTKVPPVAAAGHLFVIENEGREALLHVLTVDARKEPHLERKLEPIRLPGRVEVPPAVYAANRVLVVTDLGAAYVFEVDASDEVNPVKVSAQLPTRWSNPVNSYALAEDGRLWIADEQFSIFQLNLARGQFAPGPVTHAQDTFVAPLQRVSDNVVVHTRKRKGEEGVSVEAVAADTGNLLWRTDLNVPFAGRPHVAADGSLVVCSAQASLFRADEAALKTGGAGAPLHVVGTNDPGLNFSYRVALADEKQAYIGRVGSDRILSWDPNTTMRPLRMEKIEMEGKVAAPPIAFAGAVVVPSSDGQVHAINARTGQPSLSAFFPPLAPGSSVQWRRPAIISGGSEFVIADNRKRLYRVGVENGALVGKAQVNLERDVVSSLGVAGDTLYAVVRVDGNDSIVTFTTPELERGSETLLDGQMLPRWGLTEAGGMVFVATTAEGLLCFDGGLDAIWTSQLKYGELAGPPLAHEGDFIFASQSGTVWRVAGDTGEQVGEAMELGEPLLNGPTLFGGNLAIPGSGGVLLVAPMMAGP